MTKAGRSRFAVATANSRFAVSCAKSALLVVIPSWGSVSWMKKNGAAGVSAFRLPASRTVQASRSAFVETVDAEYPGPETGPS